MHLKRDKKKPCDQLKKSKFGHSNKTAKEMHAGVFLCGADQRMSHWLIQFGRENESGKEERELI